MGAVMWLFHFFIKNLTGATLGVIICLSSPGCARQEGKLTSYCQVVIYLQPVYETEDIIAKAEVENAHFK